MKRYTLKRGQLLAIIENLAYSQGFYGRLLRDLQNLWYNAPSQFEDLMQEWENQNFQSDLDFIRYLEA